MLVLSRRETEKILIGENIVVTIIRLSGDRARIGIDAPPEMKIVRSELLDQGKESNVTPN